jgi:type II secretory pathway predicted ATPase ExeA
MAARFHLSSLDAAESRAYITHRIQVAGGTQPVFSDSAFERIYRVTGGSPRSINNVCDLAMLVGFGAGMPMIDDRVIDEVARDLELEAARIPLPQQFQPPSG